MDFSRYGVAAQSKTNNKTLSYDQELRDYMLGVYNNMALGLAITGIIAFVVSSSPSLMMALYGNQAIRFIMFLAPLALVFTLSFKIHSLSFSAARTIFFAYSALIGVSIAGIFLVYTGTSIARTFFITASVFGGMSIYGYTTKKDLTAFGSFLFMGLLGIIVLMLFNFFFESSALDFVINLVGLAVFIGLTAYDTQKLKALFYQFGSRSSQAQKVGLMGALSLYMDFINIFLFLLNFLGDRR